MALEGTTSTDFWETTKWRWATTSSDNAVNTLLNSSTTIPRTMLANVWTPLQTFANGFISNASSTFAGGLLSLNGGASTTALTVSGTGFFGTGAFTSTSGTTTIAAGQGFVVGGSQFVVQQGSGNVGIGTSSPFSTLSVQGNGFFNGNLAAANITATGAVSADVSGATVTPTGGTATTSLAAEPPPSTEETLPPTEPTPPAPDTAATPATDLSTEAVGTGVVRGLTSTSTRTVIIETVSE